MQQGSSPQMREHRRCPVSPSAALGSSPQMRGAPSDTFPQIFLRGIIPADAGSTPPAGADPLLDEDHPRRCGEHG